MHAAIIPCLLVLTLVYIVTEVSSKSHFEKDKTSTDLLFTSKAEHTRVPPSQDVANFESGVGPTSDAFQCVGKACGEGYCCCSGKTASCVSQNLSYIPALPRKITRLNFFNNSLGQVDESALKNLTSLVVLNLEQNGISFIHHQGFIGMTRLQDLNLGSNELADFDQLVSVLALAHSLKYLNGSCNRFKNLTLSNLSAIPKLQKIWLYKNGITKIAKGEWRDESQLKLLDLGTNFLRTLPHFCRDDQPEGSFLPHLQTLNVEWNSIIDMHPNSTKCLPALENLDLSGNAIRHIRKNFLQGFPSLKILSLQFCMSKNIDSYAFNHSNLQYLNVSENLWFFDNHYGSGINPHLFRDVPNLRHINMSWTVFRYSETDERHAILSSVKQVEEFVLQGTGVDVIPQTILVEFTNLTSLSLSKNAIARLPDNAFENLTSLRIVDLHENHLTSIRQELLQDILSRDNISLDFSRNPFSCTCDMLWFIERYREDKDGIFVGDPYRCDSPESVQGQSLADVDINRHKCMLTYNTYIAILFISGFVLVLLVVGAFIYKYRWRLRFLVYTIQHRLSRDRPPGLLPTPRYDVFVSYDSNDSQWVLGTLQPELEGRRGLRLCLHERDFTPGRFITDNIIEKMEESGVILPLLSNAFLHSDWCRFELFLAIKNGIQRPSASAAQRRIAMLPVLLEDLQQEGMDSMMSALLTTTTYLAWPRGGGRREQDRFWAALCSVINRHGCGRQLEACPHDQ